MERRSGAKWRCAMAGLLVAGLAFSGLGAAATLLASDKQCEQDATLNVTVCAEVFISELDTSAACSANTCYEVKGRHKVDLTECDDCDDYDETKLAEGYVYENSEQRDNCNVVSSELLSIYSCETTYTDDCVDADAYARTETNPDLVLDVTVETERYGDSDCDGTLELV